MVACHVVPVLTSASSKEMSRMRALQSAMHSSQVPEVTSLRYSLPTCVMRARIASVQPRTSPLESPLPRPSPAASPSPRERPTASPLPRSCPHRLFHPIVGSRAGYGRECGEGKATLRGVRRVAVSMNY